MNDQDGNGRADDLDAAVAAATAAVEAAEAADQAAKDKLAELNADNLMHAGREGAAGSGEAEC
ncbi:Uncharacterised protein [Escherichia coli]|uniref:hypothetical protein n=1 Tax=Escherichia coli TaxID=562 RepID=UPI000DFE4191|nr:hypothetical protein [Escherichia coli]STH14269.1 Uncharacterised protein [Escherichia coli]